MRVASTGDTMRHDRSDAEQVIHDIIDFLRPGGRTVLLTGPHGAEKAAVLAQLATLIPGRTITVANPLVSPITLDRFLFQIGGVSDDGDDADAIVSRLVGLLDRSTPTTLIVKDAHSLNADVWPVMARVPGLCVADGPRMNLVIATRCEGPAVAAAEAADAMTIDFSDPHDQNRRDAATAVATMSGPAPGAPSAGPAPWEPRPFVDPAPVAKRRVYWFSLLAGVVALGLLGVMLAEPPTPAGPPIAQADVPDAAPAIGLTAASATEASPDPATPEARTEPPDAAGPAPVPAALAAEPPPATTALPPATPALSRPADARLRSEFADFLNRAGRDTAALSPAARDALFHDYLNWRARNPGPLPSGR